MKECRICKTEKHLTEYYKQVRNRDGLFHECKQCTNDARKQRYDNNAEHYRAKERERYQKNKRYYIDKGMMYLKKRKGAMPKWLNEKHKFFLEEIYELRDLRTKATGIVHHVDHIIPLKGDGVCGLHVPWNLQILTAFENRAKGNRY